MAQHDLKANLRGFMAQIWNSGNFDTLSTYVSPSYTIHHDPGDAWDSHTLDHETFAQRVMYSRQAFPDLRFDIQHMLTEQNQVAAFWYMSGTQRGDLDNLPATGQPFRISGITIYDFDADSKVCGHTQAYDRLGFVAQMGLMDG